MATGIIVGLLVVAVVAVVVKMVRDKRAGKSNCGCGCANCPGAGLCHKQQTK